MLCNLHISKKTEETGNGRCLGHLCFILVASRFEWVRNDFSCHLEQRFLWRRKSRAFHDAWNLSSLSAITSFAFTSNKLNWLDRRPFYQDGGYFSSQELTKTISNLVLGRIHYDRPRLQNVPECFGIGRYYGIRSIFELDFCFFKERNSKTKLKMRYRPVWRKKLTIQTSKMRCYQRQFFFSYGCLYLECVTYW